MGSFSPYRWPSTIARRRRRRVSGVSHMKHDWKSRGRSVLGLGVATSSAFLRFHLRSRPTWAWTPWRRAAAVACAAGRCAAAARCGALERLRGGGAAAAQAVLADCHGCGAVAYVRRASRGARRFELRVKSAVDGLNTAQMQTESCGPGRQTLRSRIAQTAATFKRQRRRGPRKRQKLWT